MDVKSPIIPAMVRSWIQEMLDRKERPQTRQNRFLMLEATHRVIGKALDDYNLRK